MQSHMTLKISLSNGLEWAGGTSKLLGGVAPHVASEDVLVGGAVGAVGAGEGLLSCVCINVLI